MSGEILQVDVTCRWNESRLHFFSECMQITVIEIGKRFEG